MGGLKKSSYFFWNFNKFSIYLQKGVKMEKIAEREYKGELFRKFALKLKKEKLWNKFRLLEYYFRFYTLRDNSLNTIYEYIKNEEDDNIMPMEWFNSSGKYKDYCSTHFTNIDRNVNLSEFFKHYKV